MVTDTAHGAVEGDFVTYSGAASLGGNVTAAVLNQEYQIGVIVNANSYNITAKDTAGATVTANSSDTGNGGGSTVGAYQINTGTNFYVDSTGWGVGAWGAGLLASLWRLRRQTSYGCTVRTHLAMTLYSTLEVALFSFGTRAVVLVNKGRCAI